MNEAKDSAIDAIKDVTTTVSKYITFNANKTNFFIKLRKNLDVRFPAIVPVPNLRFQVGTDLNLVSYDDTKFMDLTVEYQPNLQWSCKETWFDGEIQFDTKNKHVKYAKDFDLGGAVVKISGNYDYLNNAPFVGFQVVTQQGISTPANCNGFSLAKRFKKEMGPFAAECDVAGTITLGETVLKKSGGMQMGPTKVEINHVEMVISC